MNQDIFSSDNPLGPEFLSQEMKITESILSRHNVPYRRLLKNPALLIGRKGSGKSSLLRSVELTPNYSKGVICSIPSGEAFEQIVKVINQNTKNMLFVERVSAVWEFVFWLVVSSRMVGKFSSSMDEGLTQVNQFLNEIGISTGDNAVKVMNTGLNYLISNAGDEDISTFSRILSAGGIGITELKNNCELFLNQNDLRAIILLDSLEEFRLDVDSMHPAIGGFLKAMSRFKSPSSRCDIRCCIPAEIYFSLLDLSSNPNKDFSNSQIIHWTAIELLELAAQRLLMYIRSNDDGVFQRKFKNVEVGNRRELILFWHNVLGRRIVNGVGIEEDTLSYILRHTQLLPRHILMILNEVFRGVLPSEIEDEPVSPDRIVKAVHQIESVICNDIIAGFSSKFEYTSASAPLMSAYDVCDKMIRELPFRFDLSTFEKVYASEVKGTIPWILDANDALRVLIEVGAVGRYAGETGLYYSAQFEYTVPNRLITSRTDELCLHPVFFGTFGSENYVPDHAVYPFGADFEEQDYREWRSEVS